MIAMLKQQLSEAQAREQAAVEREKSAREREALLLQMVQDMQHRYDRLLEAPRLAPVRDAGRTAPVSHAPPRGEIRRRIVALLLEHPEGLSPAQTRQLLDIDKNLADTMGGMARDGLIRRVAAGMYVAR
jgi:hypothetical protein